MTTGDRERYEQLADPTSYGTQTNGEPVREPASGPPGRGGGQGADGPGYPGDDTGSHAAVTQTQQTPFPADGEASEYSPSFYGRDDESEEFDLAVQRRERFGGVNWGAGFFGWIVAVGVTGLLAAVSGVLVTVLDRSVDAVSSTLDSDPRTVGLVAAAVAASALLVGFYSGGYVAGRMSRYDGGKQGAGVWVVGVLLTVLLTGLVLVLGSEYDVLGRVDLPSVDVPERAFGLAGLVAAAVAALGSLLAAIGGGKVGCRYHAKIDDWF